MTDLLPPLLMKLKVLNKMRRQNPPCIYVIPPNPPEFTGYLLQVKRGSEGLIYKDGFESREDALDFAMDFCDEEFPGIEPYIDGVTK